MFRIADMPRAMIAIVIWGGLASSALAAGNDTWSVGKSSGEVWITTTSADPVSLRPDDVLNPGDGIRTGRNGRVLLLRGAETILIAPNSVISLPTGKKDGMSTTILQQAGSILLDVEKRNVKHFEVETPYLAAVVKGTNFAVTVNAASTRVDVRRGQVEVSDFKSGQIAQVLPGQAATAFAHGKPGLSLTGSGAFLPIEQGQPRASSIERIPVPKSGLSAPRSAGDGKLIHALLHNGNDAGKSARWVQKGPAGQSLAAGRHVVHISSALGEVRLNVHKATNGLAHGFRTPGSARRASTVWNDSQSSAVNATTSLNQSSNAAANAGATAAAAGATSLSGVGSATTAAAVAVSGNGNGGGNAATGNGKGNNGNGNGNGGNGNGGVGNGNGKGNGKH